MGLHMPLGSEIGRNSPEKLRALAKHACAAHLESGVPLSEAVINVLRNEHGLGSEHVRRVVEFANNDVFQAIFEKTSGDHRFIDFNGGPADPSVVLKELRMSTAEIPVRANSGMQKLAFYTPGVDSAEDIFETVKTASDSYPYANPVKELLDTRMRLQGVQEHIASSLSSLELQYNQAARDMCKVAYQMILSGTGPTDIASVLGRVSPTPDYSALALKHIYEAVGHLPAPSIVKTAAAKSAVVNMNHPLVQTFREFVKVANDRFTYASAVDIVREELARVNLRIKELSR